MFDSVSHSLKLSSDIIQKSINTSVIFDQSAIIRLLQRGQFVTASGVKPTISVIIATYYRNELLRDAIDSVLSQDYSPVELIVVDDSGEGHAAPVLAEYEQLTPIIREENGGWGTAYTAGAEASTGEYIHFLDDDDYFLPGKLSKTLEALEADPEAGVAYSGLVQDDRGLQYPDSAVSGDVLERALRFKTYPCCTITMLVEREVLLDVLPLATYGDDLDLKIELARRTHFCPVDECLVYRRKATSRRWEGLQRFQEMKRIIRNQRALYDEYPHIRRAVLAERYEEEGQVRLEKRFWSPLAPICFAKALYYADGNRVRCGAQLVASLFGRPGLETIRQVNRSFFVKSQN